MNWKIASLVAFAAWSVYGFFGERASKVHGEKVNMLFETAAFVVLSLVVIISGISDFHKITVKSSFNAAAMGLLSAGGMWFVLYAFRVVPNKDIMLVLLISGMFPIGAAIISNFITGPLSATQWTGVVLAGAGMVLVNLR